MDMSRNWRLPVMLWKQSSNTVGWHEQSYRNCNGIVMAKQLWDWLWGVNVSKSRCRLKACQLASANSLISSQGGLVQGNEPLEQRIDTSPHFSAAPAGGPWSPNHIAPGYLRWKESWRQKQKERQSTGSYKGRWWSCHQCLLRPAQPGCWSQKGQISAGAAPEATGIAMQSISWLCFRCL